MSVRALTALTCLSMSIALQAAPKTEYKLLKDLSYVPADAKDITEYQTERRKLDLYFPTNEPGFAAIVWFHGGGNRFIPSQLKNRASPSSPATSGSPSTNSRATATA